MPERDHDHKSATSTLAPTGARLTVKSGVGQQLRALPAASLRPVQQAGEMMALLGEVVRSAVTKPTGYWGDVREQLYEI